MSRAPIYDIYVGRGRLLAWQYAVELVLFSLSSSYLSLPVKNGFSVFLYINIKKKRTEKALW